MRCEKNQNSFVIRDGDVAAGAGALKHVRDALHAEDKDRQNHFGNGL
jgi:hypothetical protein